MKDKLIFGFIIWVVLAVLFYLAGSGINLSSSIAEWGTFSRVVYFGGGVVSFLGLLFIVLASEAD